MELKTAIISGGGGLGSAIAEKLINNGWQVALLSRSKPKGFSGLFYECDFSLPEQITPAVAKAISDLGSITAAIHTAVSPITRKRVLDISEKNFKDSFTVDVFGGFVFLQAAAGIMKSQKYGRLIALTTEAIELPAPPSGMAGYLSAKFALKGLLKVMHQELSTGGISVSAIAPGFIQTPLNSDVPPRLVEFLKEQSNGKLTSALEVADTALQILDMPKEDCGGKTFFVPLGETLNF